MHVRGSIASESILLTLTTSNDGLEINPSLGTILILATPAQTAGLDAKTYVYDLELEESDTGTVTRILQGNFTVRAEVTK
jgi:hypothetical protein